MGGLEPEKKKVETPKGELPGVSIKEVWMLLGEKDVQIYQLLKKIEELEG